MQRDLAAAIRDLSAAGALLEVPTPLHVGGIGVLEVELDGVHCVEWFRVARVKSPREPDGPFTAGVEFLPIAVAGHASLRDALRSGDSRGAQPGTAAAVGMLSGNTGTSVWHLLARARNGGAATHDLAREVGRPPSPEEDQPIGSTIARFDAARTLRDPHAKTTGEDR
jgi:hypothetical protein